MTHGKIIIIIFHNELNKFKSGLTLLALRQLSINRYEDKSFIIGFYARSSGRKQKMKNKDELKREPSFCYCLAQKPFEEVGSERPFFLCVLCSTTMVCGTPEFFGDICASMDFMM